ncbi:tetratricopeptide repeat protein [Desulfolutivibrio sulfoxidireducens]|uniref:tetratricopeptide repeat protein n=1 Tax=Desulfolutivibrio sulfoxidireducens TaxID=2773299 RepID=UPI00159D4876|nr:tetratricopeptide repeat protein [Desulfolutivibrio sulfoxidireducens]QLA19268.1 tetratricopeptide repeat protein [Desulfolutivibrio sulfoxidireducens]
MKPKQYDDDVREFVASQRGLFLAASSDALFNKNLRGTLIRHLSIKDDCVLNIFTIAELRQSITLHISKGNRLLVLIERELAGKPTTDIIKYVKQDHPNVLFVVLTTEVEREKLILLHEVGADNIITKPIAPDTLIEKIAFTVKPRGQIGELIDEGKRLLAIGHYEDAAEAAREVLRIKAQSPAGLILLGDAHKGLGKVEQALDCYSQAEKSAKLYLEPLKKIAALHRETGNTTEEIRFLERLDKLSPLNVDRKIEIGQGYVRLGDTGKARTVFDEAIKVATREAMESLSRVSREIAQICLDVAPELSERYLRRTLDAKKGFLDKSDIETFNRLGITLRKQGRWEDAITEYRKALKISPSDGNLYYNIAMAHTEGKQFLDAYNYLNKALSLSPDIYKAGEAVCLNIATIYRRAGKKDLVADYLKKALELNPDSRKAAAFLREIEGMRPDDA